MTVSRALLLLGALGALAYLIEGGLQQWSALQLETTLGAGPALSGLAPGLMSGSLATGRLLAQRFARRIGDRRLVALAGTASAVGAGMVAAAPNPLFALVGVTVGGLGLAAAAPTLISLAGRDSGGGERGSAVSVVSTIAYLGYLVGPPLIGLTAAARGLRLGLTAVAAAGVLLLLGSSLLPVTAGWPVTDHAAEQDRPVSDRCRPFGMWRPFTKRYSPSAGASSSRAWYQTCVVPNLREAGEAVTRHG